MRLNIFGNSFKGDNKKILFVVFVHTIVGVLFLFSVYKFQQTGDFINDTFKQRDIIIEKAIKADSSKLQEIQKLRELYFTISEIKKSYLFIAQRFNSYGYSFTLFLIIFSIIWGILGFLLIKNGWDNTDNFYLKSSFLISFFCSTLFGILPNVFNTKENTKNNLIKYNYYSGLQLDIYDLVRDNKGLIRRNTTASLDSLNLTISSITRNIKENQHLYFDTYIDKVPTDIKPLK